MTRSLPKLPADTRAAVQSLLDPTSIAFMAGTIVLWAGSHAFGVGEVVDIILFAVGALTVGWSVFDGAGSLYHFAKGAVSAKTDADLDAAAGEFAHAVVVLGLSVIQAILVRGQGKALLARGRPVIYPRIDPGVPPAAGNVLRLARPKSIPSSTPASTTLGETDAYGAIRVSRAQPIADQRSTLYHELVHRWLSPRTGPLRRFRAELSMGSYERVALLRYMEEALAEGYAQLRTKGFAEALKARSFPLDEEYVTVSELRVEGYHIGTIVLDKVIYNVAITHGAAPGTAAAPTRTAAASGVR